MSTTTVYDPATWGEDFYADPRQPLLLDWLQANGINPNDLPVHQRITLDDGTIRYVAHQTDDGRIRSVNGSPVCEARTTRCTVQPPAELIKEP